jgi:hypothetical protein
VADDATLKEAKRLMREAERHERLVGLREESAWFLHEKGEPERAAIERREADLERDAAHLAWDQALALQGLTQRTKKGLEIPIPTRAAFIENLRKVAPAVPAVAGPMSSKSREPNLRVFCTPQTEAKGLRAWHSIERRSIPSASTPSGKRAS